MSVQATTAGSLGLAPRDEEILKLCATNLLETVPRLGVAVALHIHEQLPELGGLDDAEVVEATRRSCAANLREVFVMLRAGLPATAHETPTDALEYVRFMRGRGVGLDSVLRCYQHGASMFLAVVASEFEGAADDASALQRMTDAVAAFVFVYVDRVTERLAVEYGTGRGEDRPGPDDPVWRDPVAIAAAERFVAEHASRHAGADGAVPHARREAERVLERFRDAIGEASRDERLTRRLTRADTTVRVELADEPDLAVTLMLEGPRIELGGGDHPAEVRLSLSSVDLERIWSGDFNLSMAIARGRVEATGPVRKFLRVMPIIRRLSPGDDEPDGRDGAAGPAVEPRFDAVTQAVLDRAATYPDVRDALGFTEQMPGRFWSIECRGVSKAFGVDRVLDGLDVGIPEGMITVILGPSSTCKGVLIGHLTGLMLPDQGDVIVHGRPVAELRTSELLELRRKFGILLQDGVLSSSMSVFDNVTSPLRQHTDKSEAEIADIARERLAEVGLSAVGHRAPSELSAGMRARAGLARTLVLDPEIVLVDEPDSGLDPADARRLCELMRRMHGEHGGTYVVITHDVASARRVADYLVVLWKGRNVLSGDRDDMFTSRNPFVRQFLAGQRPEPLGAG